MTAPRPTTTPGAALHHDLEHQARTRGDAVALLWDDERITYAALDALADAMAQELAAAGVRPGSRLALMASTRPEFVLTVYGALKLGAAVVLVSPAWKALEIRHAFDLTAPALVVCDGEARAALASIGVEVPTLHLDDDGIRDRLGAGSTRPPGSPGMGDAHESVLVFSSGTTGMPKAVRHTHASLAAATTHWVTALDLGPRDALQIATPPFHILGLLNVLSAVRAGARVRLHRRFDLDAVLGCVQEDRITVEMAVAPIALAMASHPALEDYDLSSLRFIMWGATPVTASVAQDVTRRTGVRFLPAYGTSEVPVITCNPVTQPARWRLDSPGLPVPGVELRIVDPVTGRSLPPGEEGEIVVHSPSAMAGYLPDEANPGAFLDGGWYRTGDVGWTEEDGWLHITDRLKEMIKVKGFQVAPAEVEAVLLSHPAVVDCAVFGVPDATTGEAVAAAVALHPDADVRDEDLRAHVAQRLSSYKHVTRLHRVEAIPRLPSGKALRRVLRERYGPDRPTDARARDGDGATSADAPPTR